MELYKKHRPKSFDDIIGQDNAIKVLKTKFKKKSIPHAILLKGPSGVGKTTIGRIIKKELGCKGTDFQEINGADKGGVDDMRSIRRSMSKAPMKSKCRLWLIDEAHKITSAAQDMMLKMLEDTPGHVYFILATTDPQKLKKTIRTRCTEIAVKNLDTKDMTNLILSIYAKEKAKKYKNVVSKIV